MKEKDKDRNLSDRQSGNEVKSRSNGYPLYPESEDIFIKGHIDKDIDPVRISKTEESSGEDEMLSIDERDFGNDDFTNNLDVPGSELDDEQEEIGSEDEENNYYSIGGDDHENLEEE